MLNFEIRFHKTTKISTFFKLMSTLYLAEFFTNAKVYSALKPNFKKLMTRSDRYIDLWISLEIKISITKSKLPKICCFCFWCRYFNTPLLKLTLLLWQIIYDLVMRGLYNSKHWFCIYREIAYLNFSLFNNDKITFIFFFRKYIGLFPNR